VEEKIEGIEYQAILTTACEISLEFREIGPAFMDDDDLPIEARLALRGESAGNVGEPFCPVVAVAGEYLGLAAIDVRLDPVRRT
jgi:hypothetical protein